MKTREIADQIMDSRRIGERWFPHDLWTQLREAPELTYLEPEGFEGFWAVVKHADLKEIATQPQRFINAPRSIIMKEAHWREVKKLNGRGIIDMDPPEHRKYRKLVNSWFVPRNIKKLEDRMRESAVDLCNTMAAAGTWEGDFVTEVAAVHPVRLITHLFGLPDSEEPTLIRLANAMFGSEDAEFMMDQGGIGGMLKMLMEAGAYFNELDRARRKNPTDDFASVIANGQIDGEKIPKMDRLGLFAIILTAGHETTRTAMSGGLHALMKYPDEIRKLKENPDLAASAVEEMVRWTSPVNQFGRTATEDYDLRGQTIQAGQSVCLFYGSANRDDEVFDAPFEFRVDRSPNPHLGFGVGEHFCLGAALARLEMKVFLEEFVPRLDIDSIEQTGDVQYLASNFVGGVKHLPMRCRVSSDSITAASA